MNTTIFNFFFSFSTNPFIAWSALFISNVLIYVFILVAILIPIIKNRDYIYGAVNLCGAAGSWIVAYILKHIFTIPRPFVTLHLVPLFMETGFSFPSSHVTVISAIATIVWSIDHKLGIAFFIFTVLVALSRMIIGVHYPIDVIAGFVLGILIGLFSIWFYNVTGQFAFLRKYI